MDSDVHVPGLNREENRLWKGTVNHEPQGTEKKKKA